MAIHVNSFRFRLFPTFVGVLWLVLTLVTAVLFLATGRPVCRSFAAWDDETFIRKPAPYIPPGLTADSLDGFLWISSSGDTYATASARSRRADETVAGPGEIVFWGQSPPEEVFDIIFRDTLTHVEVGRIERFDYDPGQFCLSPDRKLLAVAAFPNTLWKLPEGERLQSWPSGSWYFNMYSMTGQQLVEGKIFERLPTASWIPLVFSKKAKQLLARHGSELTTWDLVRKRVVSSISLARGEHDMRLWACFFDERDRPYALVSDNMNAQIELWNLTDGKKASEKTMATGSKAEQDPLAEFWQVAKDGEIIAMTYATALEKPFTKIWSLSDGKLLGSFTLDDWDPTHTAISSDGRYFLHGAVREDKAFTKLVNSWPSLARWIPKDYMVKKESKVHDLSTGVCWPGLPECERATFVQGTDRLVIFNKAGRYEYDAPSRWQYFTPWAWVALGAWLSLVAFWWRQRKRQRKIVGVV